ncbi:hypothetical protein LX36DRAFT_194398 [Colletotrichum falcatum]|nr:hypothetical protein LX36DRAFT_194398 [Colletotrichum falcatum]
MTRTGGKGVIWRVLNQLPLRCYWLCRGVPWPPYILCGDSYQTPGRRQSCIDQRPRANGPGLAPSHKINKRWASVIIVLGVGRVKEKIIPPTSLSCREFRRGHVPPEAPTPPFFFLFMTSWLAYGGALLTRRNGKEEEEEEEEEEGEGENGHRLRRIAQPDLVDPAFPAPPPLLSPMPTGLRWPGTFARPLIVGGARPRFPQSAGSGGGGGGGGGALVAHETTGRARNVGLPVGDAAFVRPPREGASCFFLVSPPSKFRPRQVVSSCHLTDWIARRARNSEWRRAAMRATPRW